MKFAAFLGRVLLVNTAAGVGAAAGVIGTFVTAAAISKKITDKTVIEHIVGAIEEHEEKKAEEGK